MAIKSFSWEEWDPEEICLLFEMEETRVYSPHWLERSNKMGRGLETGKEEFLEKVLNISMRGLKFSIHIFKPTYLRGVCLPPLPLLQIQSFPLENVWDALFLYSHLWISGYLRERFSVCCLFFRSNLSLGQVFTCTNPRTENRQANCGHF